MDQLVTVKVLKEHKNSFGETYKKVKDSEYPLPLAMAVTLRKQKLVSINREQPDVEDSQTNDDVAG